MSELIVGRTYQSMRGFGPLTYIGETSGIDGWLPTFRTQEGFEKCYRHGDLAEALVEFRITPDRYAKLREHAKEVTLCDGHSVRRMVVVSIDLPEGLEGTPGELLDEVTR